MIVFDSPTLQNGNGLIVSKTLSSTTRAITVTNYSHYFLNVESDITNGFGVLPPFTSQTFATRAGQTVTFTCQDATITAQAQVNEQISYSESTLEYATGLQSLSIPVYAQTVIGLKLLQDPNGGNIGAGEPSGSFRQMKNTISYWEFWNFDKQGRKLFINFTQPATGGNNDILIPGDPNGGIQGGYYSCSANYDKVYYFGADGMIQGWYQG